MFLIYIRPGENLISKVILDLLDPQRPAWPKRLFQKQFISVVGAN